MTNSYSTHEDEPNGPHMRALIDVFIEELEEPPRVELPTIGTKKRMSTYRSYMGGDCVNCGQWLGHIETEGGRDRHYCNATCRVQHHRKQQREKQRAATLPFSRVPVLPVSHDPLVSSYQCM